MRKYVAPLLLSVALLQTPLAAGPPPAVAAEPAAPAKRLSEAERARKAMRIATRQIGDPYKYGAEGPRRFDCSGLVYFATHRAGFDGVPRTSAEQGDYMRRIKRPKLQRGDFVFFTHKHAVYHVGVYVGRRDGVRTIVHAPSPGKKVRRDPIWAKRWFAGTLRGR